jgi:hypothetical protein
MGKMKDNSILKWSLNNNKNSTKEKVKDKKWIHSADTLTSGHVAYLVKYLGSTEVEKPKGIEVVKDGIRKLKFTQQLKKAEGTKTPKVELTISIDGVAIQEPKTKVVQHQYPLHRISYCADDKAEKRFFSFIAKEDDSDKHTCFVFVSDKLAEEITLTIGQAFDLAYQRYINGQGQEGASSLEDVNSILKDRLKDLASLLSTSQLNDFLNKHNISDVCEVKANTTDNNSENLKSMSIDTSQDVSVDQSSVDQLINLDAPVNNFTIDDINDADFDPRAGDSDSSDDFNNRFNNTVHINNTPVHNLNTPQHMVGITPPPSFPPPNLNTPHVAPVKQMFSSPNVAPPALPPRESKNPFFGSSAVGVASQDPFGMSSFNAAEQNKVDIFADLDPLKK